MKPNRADERMFWIMARSIRWGARMLVAWDEDVVDDFVEAFPEAEKTLICYTQGPHSSPMLNRAATRARDRGYFSPGHVGNMDARSFNQRTWCRCWTITDKGRAALKAHLEKAEA